MSHRYMWNPITMYQMYLLHTYIYIYVYDTPHICRYRYMRYPPYVSHVFATHIYIYVSLCRVSQHTHMSLQIHVMPYVCLTDTCETLCMSQMDLLHTYIYICISHPPHVSLQIHVKPYVCLTRIYFSTYIYIYVSLYVELHRTHICLYGYMSYPRCLTCM